MDFRNGEAPNSQDDAESFMEVLSSKKFSADQFEPTTCHTLMHPSSQLNFLEIQLNSYKNNDNSNNIQEHHLAPSMTNSYMQSDTSHVKHKLNYPVSQLFPSNLLLGESTKRYLFLCMKVILCEKLMPTISIFVAVIT